VLLRELLVAFYGSELIYVLAFGFLLLATAMGTMAGSRLPTPSPFQVRSLLLGFSLLLPLLIVGCRGLRVASGGLLGAYLPFSQQLVGMGLVLLPLGLVVGVLFERMARLYVLRGQTLAGAYAIESGGGVIGGLLGTLMLGAGIPNLATGLVCSLAAAAAASALGHGGRAGAIRLGGVPIGALLVVALLVSPKLDRRLTAWNHPGLVATQDTPYGRVSVRQLSGQTAVFANDAMLFETEGTGAEEFAHLAALQVAELRQVLVLGGGAEGIPREVLKHDPERVDYVELNAANRDLLEPFMPDAVRASLSAQSVHAHLADPRRFLSRSGQYDLILVAMGEPDSGESNRFYTREFFSACEQHLESDGVLALRLGAAENLWSPALIRRAASIHRALQQVFADVLVLPGTTNIILASSRDLQRDPDELAARWQARGIESRLVGPAYIRYLLTNDRVVEIARLLQADPAPANADGRPICYQYTLILWLSRFFPVLALLDLSPSSPSALAMWTGLAALLGLVGLMLCRRSHRCRRTILAGGAGFAGMVLEGALILGYQAQSGVLFRDIGLLITMFMAGLGLGALALDRWSRRPGGPAFTVGAALAGGMALLCLLTAGALHGGIGASMLGVSLLLLGAGSLVGGLFAYASLRQVEHQSEVVSSLYAADLAGGCMGSVAASLVLLPALGLPGAVLLAGAMCLGWLLLV